MKLEIPEHILRENPHHSLVLLPQLRALGVRLQIDNFGGSNCLYSHANSFSNLLYEQFDKLKIDRFIVSRLDNDDESLEIVNTIAMKARDYGLEMIAAGVETPKQLAQLRAIQCGYGQGYFFSKPIESKEVKILIAGKG